MTLYAFRCAAGNETIEAFFRLGHAPDTITCPDHGSPARREVARGTFLTVPGAYADTHRSK